MSEAEGLVCATFDSRWEEVHTARQRIDGIWESWLENLAVSSPEGFLYQELRPTLQRRRVGRIWKGYTIRIRMGRRLSAGVWKVGPRHVTEVDHFRHFLY